MTARIEKEFSELERIRPAGYLWSRRLESSEWLVRVRMPDETPYEQAELELLFVFPNDYPQHPPVVLPQNDIYHINLKHNANVSLPILSDDWSQFLNVSKVLLAIQAALIQPDTQTPISEELVERYQEDPDGFDEDARTIARTSNLSQKSKPAQSAQPLLEDGSLSGIRAAASDLPEILRHLDSSPDKPLGKLPSIQLAHPILEIQHEEAISEDKIQHQPRTTGLTEEEEKMIDQCRQTIDQISQACHKLEGELKVSTSEHSVKAIDQEFKDLNELRTAVWRKYFGLYSSQVRQRLQL